MSVYKRKSGNWAVLIDVDRGASGARRRRPLGTYRTRKDAERAERQAIEARDRGVEVAPDALSVSDVFERFFADSAPRLAAKTLERYREIARLHVVPHIGGIRLSKLKPVHVSDLYAKLLVTLYRGRPLSPRTVGHVHRLTHRVLRWAEKLQLVERNVARLVDAPKVGPVEPKALTPTDVRRVLDASPAAWRPFVTLAFLTGARRGELLAVAWREVDLDAKTLTIRRSLSQTRAGLAFKSTKTGRMRVVRLSSQAIVELRKLRASTAANRLAAGQAYADGDLVFADELGRPFAPDSVSSIYRGITKRGGVALSNLHAARHTAATRLLGAGTDVRSVSGILGHSAASTTLNVYGHFIADRAAAAVDALGDELVGVAVEAIDEPEFSSEGNRMATAGLKAVR